MQTIQMHLSQKQKFFLNFFVHFLNINQILNIFKKDEPHSLCISEITNLERRG